MSFLLFEIKKAMSNEALCPAIHGFIKILFILRIAFTCSSVLYRGSPNWRSYLLKGITSGDIFQENNPYNVQSDGCQHGSGNSIATRLDLPGQPHIKETILFPKSTR